MTRLADGRRVQEPDVLSLEVRQPGFPSRGYVTMVTNAPLDVGQDVVITSSGQVAAHGQVPGPTIGRVVAVNTDDNLAVIELW